MLAAVEVYNKPVFAYREEAFAILAVNAWELLLKARILELDRNRLAAILAYERRKRADGTTSTVLYRKKNRAGNYITIGLFAAHDRLVNTYRDTVDPALKTNLEALVELRDNAVHFFNKDFDLVKGIHEIGAAAVKNYAAATRQWFGVDLSAYRIFLMPLAFLSPVGAAETVASRPEERHFLEFLRRIRTPDTDDPTRDFNVGVAVEVRLRRTKDRDATPFVVSKAPDAIPITLEEADIRERYPWSYNVLTGRLQNRYADFKVNDKYHRLRRQLEQNPSLCRERLLDPGNPKSARKKFYSANILRSFDEHYERRKAESAQASVGVTDG